MSVKKAEAYRKIAEGFELLANVEEGNVKDTNNTSSLPTTVKESPVKKAEPKEKKSPVKGGMSRKEKDATEALPESIEDLTEEVLNGLSYNNLKKVASNFGVSAKGAREDINERLLSLEEGDEKKSDEAPAKPKTQKKAAAKKAESKPEPEEDTDTDADDIEEMVREALEDMSPEEIADILSDAGITPKGNKEALTKKVIKAVEEGTISFGDDSDEQESDEDGDEAPEDDSEDGEDDDGVNDLSNEDMTDERREAIENWVDEVKQSVEDKETTKKDMVEFLIDFYSPEISDGEMEAKDIKALSADELQDNYIDATSRFINDDGEMVEGDEPETYEVNGATFCCGRELEESGDELVCVACGSSYETE